MMAGIFILERVEFMLLKEGKVIEFDKSKSLEYVRNLGKGGTGQTELFKEKLTDTLFAIKKYNPVLENDTDDGFERFINEIKILFKVSHPNIVRIYNYYLYPEHKTGYIEMEYIDGIPINEYVPVGSHKPWEKIFLEVVEAFAYLEKIKVLHRDIKSSNILIDENNNVKVIDFGFGKKLEANETEGNSIVLNWPYSIHPEEIQTGSKYDHQTEIFYIGSLFEQLLGDEIESFKYKTIIMNMMKVSRTERYNDFSSILREVYGSQLITEMFLDEDKQTYNAFADNLMNIINHFTSDFNPVDDEDKIMRELLKIVEANALEYIIQDNAPLIRSFVNNSFNYSIRPTINVEVITDFIEMLSRFTPYQRKVVINNIKSRLNTVKINYTFDDDDLPF
ncbi:protein kinase family protein [Virgibacillus dokdonensis]|uniref:protein kinase family protein n=1 Tax=Virgibacillus dokdonensis TaxID=302167 RepID=UPI00098AD931|nr:protein kinase family protein [Virgibacillus dokdonensis]